MLAIIEHLPSLPQIGDGGAWVSLSKSLALYRRNDFDGTVEWATRGEALNTRVTDVDRIPRIVVAELLIAMGHFGQGDAKAALADLTGAREVMKRDMSRPGPGPGPEEMNAANWLVCQVLLREAETLIDGDRAVMTAARPTSGPASAPAPTSTALDLTKVYTNAWARAQGYERQHRWDLAAPEYAKALKAESPAVSPPQKAMLLVRLGRFAEAQRIYDQVIALAPTNVDYWHYEACLLAYLAETGNDTTEYQRHCAAMFNRFADDHDTSVQHKVAKACLLLPKSAGGDPKRLVPLIDRAIASRQGSPYLLAWGADYPRLVLLPPGPVRRPLAAADTANDLGANAATSDAAFRAADIDLLRTMAHYGLGKIDLAKADLQRAEERIRLRMAVAGEGDLAYGSFENWLGTQILRREAETLIRGERAVTTHAPPASAPVGVPSTSPSHRNTSIFESPEEKAQ